MPYVLRQVRGGWKVFTKGTTRAHSKKPMSYADAYAQMKALYANNPEAEQKDEK